MKKNRPLTPQEKQKFLRTVLIEAPLVHKAIILTLWTTGLRATEVTNMKHKNLDVARSCFINVKVKGGFTRELIPIPSYTLNWITKWVQYKINNYFKTSPEDMLFVQPENRRSMCRNHIAKIVGTWSRKAGLNEPHITPHCLRTDLASTLKRLGAEETTIQGVLGHASVKTTYMYLKEIGDDRKNKATAFTHYLLINAGLKTPIDVLLDGTSAYLDMVDGFIDEIRITEMSEVLIRKLHTLKGALIEIRDELRIPDEFDLNSQIVEKPRVEGYKNKENVNV